MGENENNRNTLWICKLFQAWVQQTRVFLKMFLKMNLDIKKIHQKVRLYAMAVKMFQQKVVKNTKKDNC